MRLQVFLSHNGVCSRRQAMEVIQDGRVKVNGVKVIEPSFDVTGKEVIVVDGKAITVKSYVYVMLNKPVGYTTTKEDPHASRIIMELLPAHLQHVAPVGRLDKDTEGLLLLTNDGDLAFKLTHPKFHCGKTYELRFNGKFKDDQKKKIEQGVMIDGEKTAPCRIMYIKYNDGQTSLSITIHEGKKRQIRRMFAECGFKLDHLKRIAMGPVKLGALPKGQWRLLEEKEIKSLS